MGDGAGGEGEGVEALVVGDVPEHGLVVDGGDVGGEFAADGVAGGEGEAEGFVGEVALPVGGRDGVGVEEAEEGVGGELGGSGEGEFGEVEGGGGGGLALGAGIGRRGLGEEGGGEGEEEESAHDFRVARGGGPS